MTNPDFFDFMTEGGGELLNTELCPHCGVNVPCSLFFDDEAECPECGKRFHKVDNEKEK